MGLQVNNLSGLAAQRQVDKSTARVAKGIEKLGSGLRINRAADDAAGLAITEGFRASIRQTNQELQGLQSGINAVRTADAGLSRQGGAVGRIRELAVQASTGTLTDDQRAAINQEAQQLLQEVDTAGQETEFNGTRLLDGSTNAITLDAEGQNQVNLNESTSNSLGLSGVDLGTQGGAQAAIDALDNAASQLTQNRAELGAQENRLAFAAEQRETSAANEQEAESRIRDLDIARAAVDQVRNQVLQQASVSALIQGNLASEGARTLLAG